MIINVVFWLGSDWSSALLSFVPALLLSILTPLVLPSRLSLCLFKSCCSHARVFEKTLVHEFTIFYRYTEWYFIFSLFDAREIKHAQQTILYTLFLM